MKAFPSLLAAAALVAAGTVPLVAQQSSATPVEIEAKITNLDASAGLITLETTKMPGQEGTTTELRYAPSHPAALTMYQVGDQVWARVVNGQSKPRVELLSYADPASADYANAGPDSLKEVQVEATITDIDRNTGKVTLETTQFPGHEGKMTLAYRLTHLGGLVLYMEGEKVLANVVVTAEGPRVKSIGSD